MKDLQIEDELIVAGGLRNNDLDCPEGQHVTVNSSSSGSEAPTCES